MSFAMTPYQHGVVREINQFGKFDPSNPQFQDYKYTNHDLSELVAMQVIRYSAKHNIYVAGINWDRTK